MINENDNQNQSTQNAEQSNCNYSDLRVQLENCLIAQKEWQERFLRLSADFENYKKRTAKDQALWVDGAQVHLLKKLLPIIDDLERAFAQPLPADNTQLQTWVAGFNMIKTAVNSFLRDVGIEEIAASGIFNPEIHEAIAQVAVPEQQSGTIIEVFQKGYKFKDMVLRPARVSVAQ